MAEAPHVHLPCRLMCTLCSATELREPAFHRPDGGPQAVLSRAPCVPCGFQAGLGPVLVAQGEVGHMSAPSPPPTVGRLGLTLQEFLNRRKMTEFGNLALIDQDAAEEGGVAIPLPGVKKGEQGVLSCPAVKPRRAVLSPAAFLADSRVALLSRL